MPTIAITGTIGSGKSQVLQSLKIHLKAETYSADDENSFLLDSDIEVKDLIIAHLGSSCYRKDGSADRRKISEIIRADIEARTTLEEILHPRLAAIWKPKSEHFRKSEKEFFIAEIPLLFEKHLEVFFDKTIVVGCSDSVRRARLLHTRSLPMTETAAWSNMQESQKSKIAKANHLLWNDGSLAMLHGQTQFLASHFLH